MIILTIFFVSKSYEETINGVKRILEYRIVLYCPERINPGDKKHRLFNKKVTSGSDEESRNWIDKLYGSIISANTFP